MNIEIYKQNAGPQSRARQFVRACAVEMHMDTSQELLQERFCTEI